MRACLLDILRVVCVCNARTAIRFEKRQRGGGGILDINQTLVWVKRKKKEGGFKDSKQYRVLSFDSTNWPAHFICKVIYETDGFEYSHLIKRQLLSSY